DEGPHDILSAPDVLPDSTHKPTLNVMSNKSLDCYHLDPQAQCLRVQVAPGHSLLLPFQELVFAELLATDSEETLTMHFDTHEVVVRGSALRRIENALQRRELSSVAVVSEELSGKARDGQPVITDISVAAARDSVN